MIPIEIKKRNIEKKINEIMDINKKKIVPPNGMKKIITYHPLLT